ncbi:flagellar export chaperone FliS [Nocardioides albidus]|uniref:Flagellar export chaperone FliS n=1 Tax=Nocardioides albidus TaxID=1517589 RepID=A0A5C4W7F3_9ACTN|nr:flagellar export chaperone FliS [Nocardioides albidus]TNM44214.1 flagellar export chaperone FliS [Nocardioides albidus]
MNTANVTTARAAYRSNAVATASPARLLVMLVERLVLDIERGHSAQLSGSWEDAHRNLLHAQDIVVELESSLRVDQMPGGRELASVYEYLRNRLVLANVRRQPSVTAEALLLARQICDTWREAAMAAAVS